MEKDAKGRKVVIVAAAVLLAYIAGSALRELTSFDEAGVGFAIGAPALIALFGMFWVADNWKDALTASFVAAYVIFVAGILAIFVFPQSDFELQGGAKLIVENFTGLVAIVVTGYFGQEAVRAAAQAYSDGKFFGPGGAGTTAAAAPPAAPPQIDTNSTR